MSIIVGAIITAAIIWMLTRRQHAKPAAVLSDGTGHLLLHARWETVIAWLVLVVAVVPAALAVYLLWHPHVIRDVSATARVLLLFSGLFGALAVWCFESIRRRIRVNDSGLTLYGGKSAIEIAWTNVTRVTTDLTGALLICSLSGSKIAVNKMLVGIPTLVSYMRRHLPENMYSGAFAYYRPRAHLDSGR